MTFNRATVYGGGLIGSGWAVSFLLGGASVIIYDINDECINAAKNNVNRILDFFAAPEINALTDSKKEDCLKRISYTTCVKTAVEDAVFIQENGPENLRVKQSIISTIEQFNHSAIIATSTSGQRVTDIAKGARNPKRIIAGHPFNPVYLMPLVELCKGELTDQKAIDDAYQFYTEIGKVPIVLNTESRGFVCNRIQTALNREVQDLVYRGVCSVEDIDKAVTFGLGLRLGLIGPHMILELAGGPGGIESNLTRFNTSEEMFNDLAKWTKRPDGYKAMAVAGVAEAMKNRSPEHGNTHESLEYFRDKGLVNLLKYHGML